MLSTDEPVALLIEKLDRLPRSDRTAILKRLTEAQREQIDRLRAASQVRAEGDLSSQLAARVTELERGTSPLTVAAREALSRALQVRTLNAPAKVNRSASLADVAGGLFRNGGSR